MRTFITAMLASLFTFMYVPASEAKPGVRTKLVCINQLDRKGRVIVNSATKKPVQKCRTMRIHKKFNGTKVPRRK